MGTPDVPAAPLPPPLPPTSQSPEMEAIRRRARQVAMASSGWRSTILSRSTIGGPGYGTGGTGGGGAGAAPRTGGGGTPGGGATCVAPDMPVEMYTGGEKPAGEVVVGDKLLGMDPESRLQVEVEVTNILLVADQKRWAVHIDGADQALIVSASHKFWVVGKGWVETHQLEYADELGGTAGGLVEGVTSDYDTGAVIGFTVTEPHTFLVDGVLSHNKMKQGP